MTSPSPTTLEREKDKWYVTDAELVRKLGIPEKEARALIQQLDENHKQTGFPQKSRLMSNRRYLKKVRAWFDRYEGLNPQDQRRAS